MQKPVSATSYILECAQTNHLSVDENLLSDCVDLLQFPANDGLFEFRGVNIETFSDGSVKAHSLKAYNLLRFSQNKLQLSVMKLLPIAVGVASGRVAVTTIIALFTFLGEFIERATKEFHDQDAKVLLAIYKLGSFCHIGTIPAEYRILFNENINEESVIASINLLESYRTVRLYTNGEVEINESVQLIRQ